MSPPGFNINADGRFTKSDDPANTLVSKTNLFRRGQISGFGARTAIFTISRVKNLSTAGPCTNLRFREETKGNLSYKWLGQWPCLSRIIFESRRPGSSWRILAEGQPRWPLYQGWRQNQCKLLFYQGRWPFYHADVKEDGAVSQMAARCKPRIATSI